MPTAYFGQPWDAPVTDDATPVPTPVGQTCVYCPDAIEAGDQGLMISAVRMGPDGEPVAGVEPVHRECLIRATVGSVDHLEGRCLCRDAAADDSDADQGSFRDQGRATLAWLARRGQTA